MNNNIKITRRLTIFILVGILWVLKFNINVFAQPANNNEKNSNLIDESIAIKREKKPDDPIHHCIKGDETAFPAEDYTEWEYIFFGSYPQSEITDVDLISEIDTEIERLQLLPTKGEGVDVYVGGIKYRRISEEDVTEEDTWTFRNGKRYGYSPYRYYKWEKIKWRVLKNEGESLFVMADQTLDCKLFHTRKEIGVDVWGDAIFETPYWENSDMREWLNTTFYNNAFLEKERNAIQNSTLSNSSGVDTEDKIFLLSYEEVKNSMYGFCPYGYTTGDGYYEDKEIDYISARQLASSDYSKVMGTYAHEYSVSCSDWEKDLEVFGSWWWLRSSSALFPKFEVSHVSTEGGEISGNYPETDLFGVVPAIRIDISSSEWSIEQPHEVESKGFAKLELKNDFAFSLNSSGVDGSGVNSILPNNQEIELDFSSVKLNYSVEEDGTVKVWAGLLSDYEPDAEFLKLFKSYVAGEEKEAVKGKATFRDRVEDMLEEQENSSFLDSSLKCTFALYGEFKPNDKKEFVEQTDLGVRVTVNAKAGFEKQFFVGSIPIIVKGSISGDGELKAEAVIDNVNKTIGYKGQGTLKVPKISYGAGVGVKKILNAGGEGSVTNKIVLTANSSVETGTKYDLVGSTEGEISVYATIFGLTWKQKLCEGESQYYPKTKYQVDYNNKFNYLSNSSACYLREVSCAGNTFRFISTSVDDRSDGNKSGIFYQVKKGDTIKKSRCILDDDGTADFYPFNAVSTTTDYFIANEKDYVYVVWMNAQREFTETEIVSEDNVATIAQNCEICVAKLDGNSGELIKKYTIESTKDDKFDYLPSISITPEGTPFVVWVKNSADNPFNTCGDNTIQMAVYDGMSDKFITQNYILENIRTGFLPVVNLVAGYNKISKCPEVFVTYEKETGNFVEKKYTCGKYIEYAKGQEIDRNSKTYTNTMLETSESLVSGNSVVSDGQYLEVDRSNEEDLFSDWNEVCLAENINKINTEYIFINGKQCRISYVYADDGEDYLECYDIEKNEISKLISNGKLLSTDYAFVEGNGELLFLVSGTIEGDEGSNIYAVILKNGQESGLVKLTESSGYTSMPSGYWDNDSGQYVIQYFEKNNLTGETVEKEQRIVPDEKIEITGVKYSLLDMQPDKGAELNVEVKNNSLVDIGGYEILAYVTSGTTGNTEQKPIIQTVKSISAGEYRESGIDISIPEDAEKETYLIINIINNDGTKVYDEYVTKICYPDMELEVQYNSEGIEILSKNVSNFDVSDISLEIYDTDKNGELLQKIQLGDIAAGKSIKNIFSYEELQAYNAEYLYISVKTPDEECTRVNNYAYVDVNQITTPKVLESISVGYNFGKEQHIGNDINIRKLDDMTVIAHYTNGESEEVFDYDVDISNINKNVAGEYKVSISYCYGLFKATSVIPITIMEHSKETEIMNAKEATCGAEGYTGDVCCKDCGVKIEAGEIIPKTNKHSGGTATCKSKAVCDICKQEYGELSQTHVWDNGAVTKEASVAEKGEKTYTCKVCEATKKEEIAALGAPKDGTVAESDKARYKVTKSDMKNGTVAYVGPLDKKATKVTIPSTVKIDGVTFKVSSVEKNAFKNNKKVKKVTIGKNVTTIGDNAFYKCTALTKISIPSKVKTIGKNAFYGCSKLKTLKIKTTKLATKKIGSKAFSKTPKSMKVTVPKKKFKTYKSMLIKKGVNKKAKFVKG